MDAPPVYPRIRFAEPHVRLRRAASEKEHGLGESLALVTHSAALSALLSGSHLRRQVPFLLEIREGDALRFAAAVRSA